MTRQLAFVSIQRHSHHFVASLAVSGLIDLEGDPELISKKAAKIYEQALRNMRSQLDAMDSHRTKHIPVPARIMWRLGDSVFRLRDEMSSLSLEIDDLYAHLVRDLNVKRKWLEKAIIFRRYIPTENLIPHSLNWGRFEKSTRRKAEKLAQGLPLD